MIVYIIILIIVLLIVISNCSIKNSENGQDFLSQSMTKSEKGIAAMLIVLHHLAQHINIIGPFLIMRYIGFILVAVFFFISGYGLMYGVHHKRNYLDSFLTRRILPILVPYWIINTVDIFYYLIQGKQFTLIEYILSYIGFDIITGTWFVTTILLLYIFFWISFQLTQKGYIVLGIFIIGYCVICFLLNLHSSYTASVAVFLLGVLWHKVNHFFILWIQKKYIIKVLFCFMLFGIAFFGRLVLSVRGLDNVLLQTVLRNLVSIFFIILLLVVTQKVQFKGFIFNWLGNISYELYMTHFILLTMLDGINSNIYLLSVLCGSLMLSTCLWKLDREILILLQKHL